MGALRIDNLTPGRKITLYFGGPYGKEEPAEFVRLIGTGDDRRAEFRSANQGGDPFEWEAYRFGGGWCYGSSANRLYLVAVKLTEQEQAAVDARKAFDDAVAAVKRADNGVAAAKAEYEAAQDRAAVAYQAKLAAKRALAAALEAADAGPSQ